MKVIHPINPCTCVPVWLLDLLFIYREASNERVPCVTCTTGGPPERMCMFGCAFPCRLEGSYPRTVHRFRLFACTTAPSQCDHRFAAMIDSTPKMGWHTLWIHHRTPDVAVMFMQDDARFVHEVLQSMGPSTGRVCSGKDCGNAESVNRTRFIGCSECHAFVFCSEACRSTHSETCKGQPGCREMTRVFKTPSMEKLWKRFTGFKGELLTVRETSDEMK